MICAARLMHVSESWESRCENEIREPNRVVRLSRDGRFRYLEFKLIFGIQLVRFPALYFIYICLDFETYFFMT